MRKLIIVVALVIGFASMASAQSDRTIGLRFGWPMEISYQQPMGDANRLELGLGFPGFSGAYLSGAYEWMKDLSNVTDGLNWYYGFGAQAGYWGVFNVGAFGLIGIEYDLEQHINFPLLASVDYRPGVGVAVSSAGTSFYPSYSGFALGLRYKF